MATAHDAATLAIISACKMAHLFFFFFFNFILFNLKYCIGFAIYQNESATGIHAFPILNPPPSP